MRQRSLQLQPAPAHIPQVLPKHTQHRFCFHRRAWLVDPLLIHQHPARKYQRLRPLREMTIPRSTINLSRRKRFAIVFLPPMIHRR